MKNSIIVIVFLALAGIIIFPVHSYVQEKFFTMPPTQITTTINSATDTSNWKTYQSQYGTLKYPADWTFNDQSFSYQGQQSINFQLLAPQDGNIPAYQGTPLTFTMSAGFDKSGKLSATYQFILPKQSLDQAPQFASLSDAVLQHTSEYKIAQQIISSLVPAKQVSGAASNPIVNNVAASVSTTYTNQNFEFQYPQSWQIKEGMIGTAKGVGVKSDSNVNTSFQILIIMSATTVQKIQSEINDPNYIKMHNTMHIIDIGGTKGISSIPSITSFSTNPNSPLNDSESIEAVWNNTAYLITISGLSDNNIRQILSSFKFL